MFLRITLNLFAFAALTSFSSHAQTTITLISDNDAALGYHDYYNTEANNYGTAIQNAAYVMPGYSGGLNVNRALIKFDLSSIPAGASIESAYLNLYSLSPAHLHSGSNNSALIERVTTDWSESAVSWITQPPSPGQNGVILPASTSSSQDYLDIDVTTLVQEMHSIENYGFSLKLLNETVTNVLYFASSDYADANKHPKLVVTYSFRDHSNGMAELMQNNFTIYPNPTDGKITIVSANASFTDKDNIKLYNMLGELVFESKLEKETELDLSHLEAAFYLAVIELNGVLESHKICVK